jgi:hypothetical protein
VGQLLRRTACWGLCACWLATSVVIAHAASFGAATIQWTAPGDDGLTGRATAYDLRYAMTPLTAANFSAATQIPGVPPPKTAGSPETFTVTGLPQGRGFYFALRTVDEAQNWSPISNNSYFVVPTTATGAGSLAIWLSPPYPNPGRSLVSWAYTLPQSARVDVEAFEITGRRVRTIAHSWKDAGDGALIWDLRDDRGRAVAPGMYLIRASLGGHTSTQRVVVAR